MDGDVISASLAAVVAYTLTADPSCLSILWSCIWTIDTCVPACQISPVPAVAGSAVCDRPRVRPVRVVPDTPVKEIHSLIVPFLRNSRHLVTVGATATVIVVSAAASFAARVVVNPDCIVCAIMWLGY